VDLGVAAKAADASANTSVAVISFAFRRGQPHGRRRHECDPTVNTAMGID